MSTRPLSPPGGREQLRGDLFGSQAANYDRFRPDYPELVFKLLTREASLTANSHVLEIGAGSGFASVPIAERGVSLTALEPSPELADIARQKLSPYPKAEVVPTRFEEADLPADSFDLIYGATSVHWVEPATLFDKSHKLLKRGGLLAFIYNELVAEPGDERFFETFEPIVVRHGVTSVIEASRRPNNNHTLNRKLLGDQWNLKRRAFDQTRFRDAGFIVYPPETGYTYNPQEYQDYLRTLSSVLALEESDREAFLAEAGDMVESQFGGQLTLHFAATVQLMKRKDS